MATAPRIAGTCYFKVDGEQLELKGGIECPLSDTKREMIEGSAGPVGYKESALIPYIKGTFIFTPNFPIEKLESNGMTITAELANGKVYTLSGAVRVGESAIKSEEGEVDLEFNGMKGIWS